MIPIFRFTEAAGWRRENLKSVSEKFYDSNHAAQEELDTMAVSISSLAAFGNEHLVRHHDSSVIANAGIR